MKNRPVESAAFGCRRIDMQWVEITAQPVECRLVLSDFTGRTEIRLDVLRWGYRFGLRSGIAAESAVRHAGGEAVPREIILATQIIDRGNCEAWDKPYDTRATVPWHAAVG